MEITYGNGIFLEDKKKFEGTITLSEHKLFLKDSNGDLPQTYVPLEKIERVKYSGGAVDIQVRPTLYLQYVATFKGQRSQIKSLTLELVQRRGLKKKFLRNEWIEEAS